MFRLYVCRMFSPRNSEVVKRSLLEVGWMGSDVSRKRREDQAQLVVQQGTVVGAVLHAGRAQMRSPLLCRVGKETSLLHPV